MRINSVRENISFNRQLTANEVSDYSSVLKEGKKLAGQTGHSVFIMPTSCLPQTDKYNSGVGHLSSDISVDFLKYIKTYLGINAVEDLPAGQVHKTKGFYCAYKGTGLSLGTHQINPELLTTKEFGELLSPDDIQEIANANTMQTKNEIVNFANVADTQGMQNKILKKAYKNFNKLDKNSPLKLSYKQFVTQNADWLKIQYADEPDKGFFKFKQFLAEEHLKFAKSRINEAGLKLCGDMPIGFSKEEVAAFPKAFKEGSYIGTSTWRTPSLNYDEIFNPTSDAYKMLKRKVQLYAKRYDMLRIDAGWLYVTPNIKSVAGEQKKELGSGLLSQIEDWIKEVKGSNFDLRNVFYEFEADRNDFEAFRDNEMIPAIKNRMKAFSTQYMHITPDEWGFNKGFLNRGLLPDEFIIGVGNHDHQPLRQIANGIADETSKGVFRDHKINAIPVLSKIFNIPESVLQNPIEFAKAKFADIMGAKNNYMFYMDVLGRDERFDPQWKKLAMHMPDSYAYKVPTDYKTALHKAFQSGYGLNPMDALEKIFIQKGLNRSSPELFDKIVKYKNILASPLQDTLTNPPQIPQVKQKLFLPILFCAVGVLSVASLIKYIVTSNKSDNQA